MGLTKLKNVNGILTITGCFFAALMLQMRFVCPDDIKCSGMPEILENLKKSLNNSFVGTSVLFFLLYYATKGLDKVKSVKPVITYAFCMITACLWLLGESFRIDNTTDSIHYSSGQCVKSVIYVYGAAYLLFMFGKLILAMRGGTVRNEEGRRVNMSNKFYLWLLIILMLWLPGIVITYPAAACYDAWDELSQYFGYTGFNAHHPPLYTVFIGLLTEFGILIGDVNIGFFMISLLQSLAGAVVTAYMLYTMRKEKIPKWLEGITFLMVVICPYFNAYNVTVIKDTLYSYAFLLFVIELYYFITEKNNEMISWKHGSLLAISIILLMLLRNNGKYVVYISAVVFCLQYIKKGQNGMKQKCRYLFVWIVPVITASVISMALISFYNVEENKRDGLKEAFSILFQQTARDVKENESDITTNEREVIDKILQYDKLAERYDPRISDPVKATFRYEVTDAEIKNYLKVWSGRFFKHPFTYFKATINQNYYLIYPFLENVMIYDKAYVDYFYNTGFLDNTGVSKIMAFDKLNDIRTAFYGFVQCLPVTGLMSCIAFWNIVMMFMLLYAAFNGDGDVLLLAVPILVSDLIIIAAPVIQYSPRYAFPVIYAMPMLITIYLKSEKNSGRNSYILGSQETNTERINAVNI